MDMQTWLQILISNYHSDQYKKNLKLKSVEEQSQIYFCSEVTTICFLKQLHVDGVTKPSALKPTNIRLTLMVS